ncbi:acetamidase/formamidase family protein [Christensenellaceae bacterium OttesenSCG-928-M15]|nr:acetamidase/formamidase family protein [Christensenellaceae bacterium OttesenSCG-928-M15]
MMLIINQSVYTFSPVNQPVCSSAPGAPLLFKTMDCYSGQIRSEEQLIDEIDLAGVNPAAGPVFIEGAQPGDVLAVDILDIKVDEKGFACSIPSTGPLNSISVARTKMIPVKDGYAHYNDIMWPICPMVGVIGTAPGQGSIPCGHAGNHGGNMDSRLIKKGSRLYLPVRTKGALLQMGDIHATMGDGEICGNGLEIAGEILVTTTLLKNFSLHWPVTESDSWWHVNATGKNYDEALLLASMELCRLMQPVYKWDATDIFIYLSLQGNVEINQGTRPVADEMVNVRIGIPKTAGKPPLIGPM